MKPFPLFSNRPSPTLLGFPSSPINRAIPVILSIIFLSGCREAPKGPGPEEPNNEYPIETQVHVEVQEKTETAWIDEISLDQGAKWTANIETTAGVSDMLALIESSKADATVNHQKLGDGLNEIKNMIVKECTMTGASHDNLHIWLYPLISKIELLQKAESRESGIRLTEEIQDHLEKYYDYFN